MASRKGGYQGRHQSPQPDPPARPGTKPASGTRRRGPQHETGQEAARPVTGAARTSQRRARSDRVGEAARDYANRSALRSQGAKPSVTGQAIQGAAAGTAAGAALGGPPGAVVGAAVGGTTGALAGRKAKKAFKAAMHASPGAKRALVAEFMACFVIAALSPLTDRHRDEPPTALIKRLTSIMLLFFFLGLISAAGRGTARFAAGFGGLVTLALAVSERDLFAKIAGILAPDKGLVKSGARSDKQLSPAPEGSPS